ncbi:DNA primase [Streptomyces sp. NBRC 14336]|uniref:DNA primase n=1 Tax=Streptomyces sp. NBRC 14336 TaxID=3030992 RepID=UPI0025554B5D|nr:DNA primase [Streptomyces sp. NBRC 14336]
MTEPTHAAGQLGHDFVSQSPGGDAAPLRLVDGQEQAPRSWQPQDLRSVLDGTYKPPQPSVGRRDDGVGLFYPGRVSSIASESEAGKTWFALIACLQEINDGNHVVYLDFEDDAGGVVGRLLVLGALPGTILEFFHYIRPEAKPGPVDEVDLAGVLQLSPTLAIVDGVTEAMAIFGLELKDNTDVASFGRRLLRPMADSGAAVVTLDHVVKSGENRGRYSLGGVHKLNGLNGVMYVMENVRPFGVGVTGKSRVRIAKDRPAQLRKHGLPGKTGMHWFADLVIKSHDAQFAEGHLYPPIPSDDTAETAEEAKEQERQKRASKDVQDKVLKVLAEAGKPLSKKALEGLVGGRAAHTRVALEVLVARDEVVATPGARGAIYHSLPSSSDVVPPRPTSSGTTSPPRPSSSSPLKEGDEDEDEVGPETPGTRSLILGTPDWHLYSAPAGPGRCGACGETATLYRLPFKGTHTAFCTACLPEKFRRSNNLKPNPCCARCGLTMPRGTQDPTHADCKEPS